MAKINILHIVLTLGTGGLENGIVNIINGSDPEKFTIDVLCLRGTGELAQRIKNNASQVITDESADASLISAVKRIRQACNDNAYDIIHTHGWATMLAGYIATMFSRTPIVINGEHGTLYYETWRQRFMQKFLFNRMKLNLSVSQALVEEISRKFGVASSRFKAILNGVDIERFQPDTKARMQVRQALNIEANDVIIGSVGRLVEVKNYPSLLKAFSLVSQRFTNVKLMLAGDGPLRDLLEEMADTLGIKENVLFLGRREDVAAVMNAMDIFVLPSFREGLSNTVLEAMASGLPVVVTNVGGNPEIVVENQSGFLFTVSDCEQLASMLSDLIANEEQRKSMSDFARSHVVHHYSLQVMIESYQKTYQSLIFQHGVEH